MQRDLVEIARARQVSRLRPVLVAQRLPVYHRESQLPAELPADQAQ